MSSARSSAIDWEQVKQRVAALGKTLDQAAAFSSDETIRILQARAERLARVEATAEDRASIEVMILKLSAEDYALETRWIREVIRPSKLTPLPQTASHFAGLMNLHGRPLLVIDVRPLLGLPQQESPSSGRVVVVGQQTAEFGLLADATEQVTSIAVDDIAEPPQSLPEATRSLIRGVVLRNEPDRPREAVEEVSSTRRTQPPFEADGDPTISDTLIVFASDEFMSDPRLWIDDQDD